VDEVTRDIQAASEGAPVAAATLDVMDPSDVGVSVPAWLVKLEAGSQPSDSSDNMVFAPVAEPTAPRPAPLVAARPILSPRNLMMIARSAYGRGRAEVLVPALLSGFETNLTHSEILDRLRLL